MTATSEDDCMLGANLAVDFEAQHEASGAPESAFHHKVLWTLAHI